MTPAAIEQAMARPVVQQQLALLRLRNTHAAFDGDWTLHDGGDHELAMTWTNGDEIAHLSVDLAVRRFELTVTVEGRQRTITESAALTELA